MSATIYNSNMLPRFVLGGSHLDDLDSDFVIHLHSPRFVMRMNAVGAASEDVQFIDPPEPLKIARLMRDAGEFYAAEIQLLEEE